jgi:DNA polymerase-3 subunit alpha
MRVIRTKSGQQMAFLNVTDTKKKFDVTIFPETFSKFRESLTEGGYYYLTGKIQNREGDSILNLKVMLIGENRWRLNLCFLITPTVFSIMSMIEK